MNHPQYKYVVTGATSFLGLSLVARLLQAGHSVVAVCRPASSAGKVEQLVRAGAQVVLADMSEYGSLYRDVPQADVFVNLAWQGTGHDGRDDKEVQEANVACSIAALFGADKMGCSLFVEAGSQAEYGTVLTTVSEQSACNPFSEYGKAKLQVKEELFSLSRQLGMKYLHLRIFSLFGEADHPWTLIMTCVGKMLAGQPVDLSDCTQQWNFLYVDDAAWQVMALCSHALASRSFGQEVYHVASPESRPLREFVERIRQLTASASVLNFGAVKPRHVVSLQPSMAKTAAVVSPLCRHTFDEVVQRIITQQQKHHTD